VDAGREEDLDAGQSGQQARAQQGRLARAGRAEHGQERLPRQAGSEVLDEPVAAEEPVRVLLLERREALVRRVLRGDGRLRLGGQAAPALLPLVRVAVARADVRERHGQRRELAAGRRLGERGRRVVGLAAELAVADPAGLLAQLAQVRGERHERVVRVVEWTLAAWHQTPIPDNHH
jgi:hypothetical protein